MKYTEDIYHWNEIFEEEEKLTSLFWILVQTKFPSARNQILNKDKCW